MSNTKRGRFRSFTWLKLSQAHYLSPLSSEHAIDDYYGDQQDYLDATAAEEKAGDGEEVQDAGRDEADAGALDEDAVPDALQTPSAQTISGDGAT